jgi:hypothetical protein
VWVHQWQAVQHPHHAVQEGRHVRDRRVLLHCTLLPDADESWPVNAFVVFDNLLLVYSMYVLRVCICAY